MAILFKEHQAQFPDNNALKRSSNYSLGDFQEEIVRQLCGFGYIVDSANEMHLRVIAQPCPGVPKTL